MTTTADTTFDFRHGAAAYRAGLCTCETCTRNVIKADKWQALVKTRQKILADNPDAAPHGVYDTFKNWGCRCRPCHEASRRNRAERESRTLARTGRRKRTFTSAFGREWIDDAP